MKKITAQEVLDKMTQACNLHDDFIGEVNKKYDLPEDGTAKEAKYDAPVIDLLLELADDLDEMFDAILEWIDINEDNFDEDANIWAKSTLKVLSEIKDIEEELQEKEEYANAPADEHAWRDFLEELYVNQHECMKAIHLGIRTLVMFNVISGGK